MMGEEKTSSEEIRELQQQLLTLRELFEARVLKKAEEDVKKRLEYLDNFKPKVEVPELKPFNVRLEENKSSDVVKLRQTLKKMILLYKMKIEELDDPVAQAVLAL